MRLEPQGHWEPGDRAGPPDPVVKMHPTSFRTYRVFAAGTPGRPAIQIVGAAPYPQRVVVLNRDPLSIIFVAFSPNEMNIAPGAGAIPAGAFGLFANDVQEFAVAPGQGVYAAGDGAVALQFISVSASAAIPPGKGKRPEGRGVLPTTFRTFTLRPSGVAGAATQVASASKNPQRVVITGEPLATNIRVTSSSNELESPGVAAPSGAYAFDAAAGAQTLVLAPDQPLFATLDPTSPVFRASVSVSEIDPYAERGATGIPGAGGTE